MRRRLVPWVGLLLVLAGASRAWALGEEHVGNDPLPEANYTDWPGIMPLVNDPNRVYHIWVNGNEYFYYRGATAELNGALKKFAALKSEPREVVIHPGPGVAHRFSGETIACDWELHVVGGIAKHQTTLDKGDQIWSKSPILTIYLGGGVTLDKIVVPEGITLLGLADLKQRYSDALAKSTDKSVRGWGCGQLATLDKFDAESIKTIAQRLKDDDNWVRLNAAGALSTFGAKARGTLDELRAAANSDDAGLKQTAEKTIADVQAAADNMDEERLHRERLAAIDKFLESHRKAK